MKKTIIIILLITLLSLWYYTYEEIFNINITVFEVPDKIYLIVGETTEIAVNIEEKDNRQIVMSYVNKNNLKFGNLLKNKQKLKEMVMYLRNEEKMSYRDMEKELEISRETIRKLIK